MAKKVVKDETISQGLSQQDKEVENRLLELREDYRKLHERKIATERDRQNLEERMRELREQAEGEYGTSDVEKLRELLAERREANDRMVAEYEQHIRSIQQRLEAIESAGDEER
jgi:hypothetical protein